MDTGGETTGIGHVLCRTGSSSVQFRQTVDKVMVVTLDTVVHGKVNDFQVFRYVMAFHEFLRVTVSCAEEKNINFVQR